MQKPAHFVEAPLPQKTKNLKIAYIQIKSIADTWNESGDARTLFVDSLPHAEHGKYSVVLNLQSWNCSIRQSSCRGNRTKEPRGMQYT